MRAGDPQPGPHPGPITVVIEASDTDKPVTVYYTRDGSLPTRGSASFTGHAQFDMTEDGNYIIACYATDSDGRQHYQTFHYTLGQSADGAISSGPVTGLRFPATHWSGRALNTSLLPFIAGPSTPPALDEVAGEAPQIRDTLTT